MRRKLEVLVSMIAANLISFYIVLYLMKETELLRCLFGSFMIGCAFFGFFLWLFEIAYTREERKKKKHKKSIDELSLE